MISNGSWLDVLEPRRDTSDLIWLIFHDWNSEKYAYSKNRDPKEIRDAVYNEPYIRTLLEQKPALKPTIERILDEMSHTWSLKSIRFMGFFLLKIMKSIYRSIWVSNEIHINPSSIYFNVDQEKSLSQTINFLSSEAPILYMPTHRSYADFLVFSYVCFHMHLPLPAIAAGLDFLSLNVIASLLRACGAFFIRRSFKNSEDTLYWDIFRAYVQTQIRGGEKPLEFFIEGTRSRSGKSLNPKTGLLSVALELFLTSQIPDLIIIPVSISYDRTLEEDLYSRELSPPQHHSSSGTKPPETAQNLLQGARAILSRDYGSIYIKFCTPISLRDVTKNMNLRFNHALEPQIRRSLSLTKEDRDFISNLSKSIVKCQCENFVISPFPLIAMAILTQNKTELKMLNGHHQIGMMSFSIDNLQESCTNLSSLIDKENLNFSPSDDNYSIVIMESINVHSNLVKYTADQNILVDVSDNLTILKLRHYANQSINFFSDLAVSLSANSYEDFLLLRSLLSRELVFVNDNSFYEVRSKNEEISNSLKEILVYQVKLFIISYYLSLDWLLEYQVAGTKLNVLAKTLQKHIPVSYDIAQNLLQLLYERSALTIEGDLYYANKPEMMLIFNEILYIMDTCFGMPSGRDLKSKL